MEKNFYIFRHGETDYNKKRIRQGQKIDAELNEVGVFQAENLAAKIKDLGVEIIYSSPLKRAKKTAETVSDKLGVDIVFEDDLKEGCFGIFEGMQNDEIADKHFEIATKWDSMDEDTFDYRIPEGESKIEMYNRIFKVLENLLSSEFKNIAISTHGRIATFLLVKLGSSLKFVPNAEVVHVRYKGGNWSVVE